MLSASPAHGSQDLGNALSIALPGAVTRPLRLRFPDAEFEDLGGQDALVIRQQRLRQTVRQEDSRAGIVAPSFDEFSPRIVAEPVGLLDRRERFHFGVKPPTSARSASLVERHGFGLKLIAIFFDLP